MSDTGTGIDFLSSGPEMAKVEIYWFHLSRFNAWINMVADGHEVTLRNVGREESLDG